MTQKQAQSKGPCPNKQTHTHAHTSLFIRSCQYFQEAHTRTHRQTHTHTRTDEYTHTHTHRRIHAHAQTNTHTHNLTAFLTSTMKRNTHTRRSLTRCRRTTKLHSLSVSLTLTSILLLYHYQILIYFIPQLCQRELLLMFINRYQK